MSEEPAKYVSIFLSDEQLSVLADVAKYTGVSRDNLLRMAAKIGLMELRHCLSEEANQKPHDCQIVSGFVRHLGREKK